MFQLCFPIKADFFSDLEHDAGEVAEKAGEVVQAGEVNANSPVLLMSGM